MRKLDSCHINFNEMIQFSRFIKLVHILNGKLDIPQMRITGTLHYKSYFSFTEMLIVGKIVIQN